MVKEISYRYRVPFGPTWRGFLAPIWPVAILVALIVLFYATHRPVTTARTLDPVGSGDAAGDVRPVLWVDEGLRYRVHVREGAELPDKCTLNFQTASYAVKLDRTRHHGDPATVGGYRWLGAFRAPAGGRAALGCDTSSQALRVHVDAPGERVLVALMLAWGPVLILSIYLVVRARRRGGRPGRVPARRPMDPVVRVAPAALEAADRDRTTVYFRNGAFVAAGERDPRAAADEAAAVLAALRDPAAFRVAETAGGGRLVIFPDVTVHLTPHEIKHAETRDLGRHARAKIGRDARAPEPVHVRPAEPVASGPG
ncbi:hypothetical protein [Actinomadura roseirufa]|uniref:hypothetical protein n=1 Tax=Actinomadura roseirufa TaxID=2094049 RepID=UPI0013F151E0|nr:hypothetical protein [Actinomadura roseirufa]